MSDLLVAKSAVIGEGVTLGNNVVVNENASIGSGCVIGNNVVIHSGSVIGSNVRIDDNAVVGKLPMRSPHSVTTKSEPLPASRIGDESIIGTSTILYRGCVVGNKVLVADLSTVREDVTIGEGTIIGRGVAIENSCKVGKYCKLETNVYLTAYSVVEDRCFVAPCVVTSNDNYLGRTKERFKHFKGVTLRKGGRIGANATILPGKVIGEDTVVAAGAVVTKDLFPGKIYAGVPARELKDVPEAQLLRNQDFQVDPSKK